MAALALSMSPKNREGGNSGVTNVALRHVSRKELNKDQHRQQQQRLSGQRVPETEVDKQVTTSPKT